MTTEYILAAGWGLVLFTAFVGYGKLLHRSLFPHERPGWAEEGAWGMACVVILGGVLNYLRVISPSLLLFIVLCGSIICILDLARRRAAVAHGLKGLLAHAKSDLFHSILKLAGFGVIVALTAIQYLGSVTTEVHHLNYVVIDDLRGYYLFPKQMLQAGGITADPFNLARLGNGLGGQAILHACMLLFFDFFNILLVEVGISLILCVGLVWQLASRRGLTFPTKWTLTLLFLSLPYYPSLVINSSSFVSGILMLLAIFSFLDRESSFYTPVRNACIISMLTACIIALKTTFMPPVAMVLVLSYLWFMVSSRFEKRVLLEALLVPVFTGLMLLPWMLALFESSGTLLYQVFGTGFDDYNYGNYIEDIRAGGYSLKEKLTIIYLTFFSRDIHLILAVTGTTVFVVSKLRQRAAAHAFAIAAIISSLIFLLLFDLTKIVSMNRYTYGAVFTALLVVILELMAELDRRIMPIGTPGTLASMGKRLSSPKSICILVVLAGAFYLFFIPYGYAERTWTHYQFYLNILPKKFKCQGTFFDEAWQSRYLKAQETVPPGETILVRDIGTAAFNFDRNDIYNMSLPGTCSLPPGMPYFSGPEMIAEYLLSHDIRYVAYAYANDGGFPIGDNIYKIRPDAKYFDRVLQRVDIAFSKALNELGATRKRLYDDGALFIIDLQVPAQVPRVYHAPNYFQKFGILTPGIAETSGFYRNKIWTNGHGVIEGIIYVVKPEDKYLVLNTFGYHPWLGDVQKLALMVSVNDKPLPLLGFDGNSYYFLLATANEPITRITVDSKTFIPREESIRFGKDDDMKILGIDVDTIEIKSEIK